jgi:hypothetical protein
MGFWRANRVRSIQTGLLATRLPSSRDSHLPRCEGFPLGAQGDAVLGGGQARGGIGQQG